MYQQSFQFGVYAGSVSGTPNGLASGPNDDLTATRKALDELQGDERRSLVVRAYLHYTGAQALEKVGLIGGDDLFSQHFAEVLSDSRQLDLVICFHDPIGDVDGWKRAITAAIKRYASQLARLQITEEANLKFNTGAKSNPTSISSYLILRALANPASARSPFLIEPIQDLAWALMRPVPGSSLRVLHFMQTQQFKVPPGLNTPIESSNWLASGSIGLRRSLLAVMVSLILSASRCSTLTSEAGKGLPFWTKMRALHGPEDRREFSRRTATWSRLAAAGLEFYR